MKKTYQKPELKAIEIQTELLIAASYPQMEISLTSEEEFD